MATTFSRRTLSILTVLLILGLLGGGIWWRLQADGEETNQAEASETDTAGLDLGAAATQFSTDVPQPVRAEEVIRDTLWISVTASGRAAAIRRATVNTRVEGLVREIPVRENSPVQEGAVVLQIDTTELALEVAQARSDLLNAEAEYESLVLSGGEIQDPEVRAQREQVARASSGLNSAEVALRRAEMDLRRASVRVPFAGRIADLAVVPGEYVTAGTELMTVVDLNPIKVEAEVLEAELATLQEGRRATAVFAAFPGEEFQGTITSINPLVDVESRSARVTILLDNPGGRIRPGMYAEVRMEAQSFPDRLLVPRSAILERGQGRSRSMLYVYSEDGGVGRAKWRYVNPGRENETLVEILPPDQGPEDGTVEPGEMVLVDGHHFLAHDTRVTLVEDVENAGGRPGR